MKVKTLDDDKLREHVAQLHNIIAADDARYDIVVGIASGGVFVSSLYVELTGFPPDRHIEVKLQRPSTRHKKSFVKKSLRKLPVFLRDILRIMEARILAMHRKRGNDLAPIEISLPESIENTGNLKALVIDDAVDSGATMLRVVKSLHEAGIRKVATAALTVTTSNPEIVPDYAIYRDGTLLRFPWSSDYT